MEEVIADGGLAEGEPEGDDEPAGELGVRERRQAEPWWSKDESATQLVRDAAEEAAFRRSLKAGLQQLWDELPVGAELTERKALRELRRRGQVSLPPVAKEGDRVLHVLVRRLLRQVAEQDGSSQGSE